MFNGSILPKSIVGLHVHFASSSERVYSLVQLEKVKKEYILKQSVESVSSLQDVGKHISSKHIVVSITGRGVLNKLAGKENESLASLIPGFNEADFYVQQQQLTPGKKLVSFSKRKLVDDVLSELQTNNYQVIYLSLGIQSLPPTIQLFDQVNRVLLRDTEVVLENGAIQKLNYNESIHQPVTYSIENKSIPESILGAYLCCIVFLQAFISNDLNDQPDASRQNLRIWKANRVMRLAGLSVLVCWLAVLLVNFFLNSQYSSDNEELEKQFAHSYTYIAQMDTMEHQVEELEYFIKDLGIDGSSRYAFYADQVGQTVPADIALTSLQINPVNNKNNDGKLEFNPGVIRLAGTCYATLSLNSWINRLSELAWVNTASLKNYSKAEDKNTGTFELTITLR